MNFKIEFVCTDLRPLRSTSQKQLLPYLKPLHARNEPIVKESPEQEIYYKHLGLLKPNKHENRTLFASRNFLRLPQFEKYRLNIRNCKYDIVRGPKIERNFVSEIYGVINRLCLDFDFRIKYPKPSVSVNEKSGSGNGEGQKTFELIKFLSRLQVHIKRGKDKFPLYELGDKMADLISISTVPYKKPDDPAGNTSPAPNAKNEVIYTEKVCAFICRKDEITAFPGQTKSFYMENCPEGIEIKYYDFNIKSCTDTIRVFFIIHERNIPADYLERLRSELLDLWTYYWSLEKIISKNEEIGFHTRRIDDFIECIQDKINSLNKNKRFNFVNLKDLDCGEIMCSEKRKAIRSRLECLHRVIIQF